jgi:hypothetical protein
MIYGSGSDSKYQNILTRGENILRGWILVPRDDGEKELLESEKLFFFLEIIRLKGVFDATDLDWVTFDCRSASNRLCKTGRKRRKRNSGFHW